MINRGQYVRLIDSVEYVYEPYWYAVFAPPRRWPPKLIYKGPFEGQVTAIAARRDEYGTTYDYVRICSVRDGKMMVVYDCEPHWLEVIECPNKNLWTVDGGASR